ncbi:MAG: cytochrome c biogenesis CcdA family protein [Methanobacteriaceae archaeon]
MDSLALNILPIFSFLAGVASVLSPCILPVIPVLVGYFISKKTKSELISFILGFSIIFIIVILVTIGFTAAINYYIQYIRFIASFIIIIIGILMLLPLKSSINIFNSNITNKVNRTVNNSTNICKKNSSNSRNNINIQNRINGTNNDNNQVELHNNDINASNIDESHFNINFENKKSYTKNSLNLSKKSFTAGLLSSLAWSSCYGSYLIALISFSVSSGEPFYSGLNIILYVIGFSISIFIIGLAISSINIQKIGAKSSLINKISGLLILIGGVYLLLVQVIGY